MKAWRICRKVLRRYVSCMPLTAQARRFSCGRVHDPEEGEFSRERKSVSLFEIAVADAILCVLPGLRFHARHDTPGGSAGKRIPQDKQGHDAFRNTHTIFFNVCRTSLFCISRNVSRRLCKAPGAVPMKERACICIFPHRKPTVCGVPLVQHPRSWSCRKDRER